MMLIYLHEPLPQSCLADADGLSDQMATLNGQLQTCLRRASTATVDLWYVHQGDGRGLPEGHNGEIHNHDNRSNWNSRRFRAEACPQRGGPLVNDDYASRLCGSKRTVGQLGVLDIGGGTCGHGIYLIACVN